MKYLFTSITLITIFLVQTQQDKYPYPYQTNTYYYDVYKTNKDISNREDIEKDSLPQNGDNYKQDGERRPDMHMVVMGSSMISGLLAAASIAYALSLEARIITLNSNTHSRISSLETDQNSICTAVKSFTSLSRTDATGAANSNGMHGADSDLTANTVEGRNYAFINLFTAVSSPTC